MPYVSPEPRHQCNHYLDMGRRDRVDTPVNGKNSPRRNRCWECKLLSPEIEQRTSASLGPLQLARPGERTEPHSILNDRRPLCLISMLRTLDVERMCCRLAGD